MNSTKKDKARAYVDPEIMKRLKSIAAIKQTTLTSFLDQVLADAAEKHEEEIWGRERAA